MKIIRMITLCSGYDSQMMAARRVMARHPGEIEFDLIAWAEIDKFAIQAHNAVFPEYADRNVGDISKADWTPFVGKCDLLTYSTPCFKAGTLIFTDKGYKPIEDVTVGDYVLTHTNSFQRVLKIGCKPCDEIKVVINPMCAEHIHCTQNHPFYVRERKRVWDNVNRTNVRTFSTPKWIEAKDLTKNHFVGVAVPTIECMPQWEGVSDNRWGHNNIVNNLSDKFNLPSFWYLMGRYVGDGWARNDYLHKGILICCGGRNLENLTSAISNCGYKTTVSKQRTVSKFTIYSKELVAFVERYGHRAHNKVIDNETICLPKHLLKSFIDGLMDSDGCFTNNSCQLTTTSRNLAYTLGLCIAKVYNTPFSIIKFNRPAQCTIEGRIVNQRDTYMIRFKQEPKALDRAFFEDGHIWCPITWIKQDTEKYLVYNMEVENDNSYTANGVIVHNCQSISVAGKQAGLTEGDDAASALIWEVRRAIETLRPKYLIFENVANILAKRHIKEFVRWCKTVESFGYVNFRQVMDAKDYGVPQHRERMFMVSILKEADCTPPTINFLK